MKFIRLTFLLFSLNSFSQQDAMATLATQLSSEDLSMNDMIDYAKRHTQTDLEKAKLFYYWIGQNIKYDHKLLERMRSKNFILDEYLYNDSPEMVFDKKLAVCRGYAVLYEWFLNEFDIFCTVVTGHIRDQRNHYIELDKDDSFRHAWNIIEIDEDWMLLDTTWGTSLDVNVSDFYFDIPPQQAIITHYPAKVQWQLLDDYLSLEEFNNSQFINPLWFMNGFNKQPSLKADQEFYYYVFETNPNKEWRVNIEVSSDNLNFAPIEDAQNIEQDGFTYVRFERNQIPKKAFFKVNLSNVNSYGESVYTIEDIINFKI